MITQISLKDVTLLAGRALLALIFIHEGYTLATNFTAGAAYMAKQGISLPLFVMVILLQLCGGLGLVIGLMARPCAIGLGLFCLATAFLFHTRLSELNELLHFEKDLGLAGGLFVLALGGAGALSIDHVVQPWLRERARRRPAVESA